MAIGLDNTNVNISRHNSIKSPTEERKKDIVIASCPCHILHNASAKAAMAFSEILALMLKTIAWMCFIGSTNLAREKAF